MIWRLTARNHTASIGSFARHWLAGSLLDRLIPVTVLGLLWCLFWGAVGVSSRDRDFFLGCVVIATLPWDFWLLDAYLDAYTVQRDIATFAREGAILATRCEYLGGHPQLPQGRFIYLVLAGTRPDPALTLVFPQPFGAAERFILPVLDLTKTKPEKGSDESPAADIAAAIHKDAGGWLRPQRLTLVVDYDGAAGRKHKVELTNFFHGNDEVRNWRNYLVCAQAQADTGVEPHEPWVSLPDDPEKTNEEAVPHAFSRNGDNVEQPSSAFRRG